MSDSEMETTVILNPEDSDLISEKLSAVNNEARFSILKILRDFDKENKRGIDDYKKEPLYSREINTLLLKDYNINISTQMLGQHMKQLIEAGLVKEWDVKKEVPNKIGSRSVKGFVLREDAFEEVPEKTFPMEDMLGGIEDIYNEMVTRC